MKHGKTTKKTAGNLNVDLPLPIRKAIEAGSKKSMRTLRAEVTVVLAKHYGLSEYLPTETAAAG